MEASPRGVGSGAKSAGRFPKCPTQTALPAYAPVRAGGVRHLCLLIIRG
jgi:hypothetical protein